MEFLPIFFILFTLTTVSFLLLAKYRVKSGPERALERLCGYLQGSFFCMVALIFSEKAGVPDDYALVTFGFYGALSLAFLLWNVRRVIRNLGFRRQSRLIAARGG